ncbi:cysteine-rich repeat secretory protein 55-like [Vitis riparia]|uniref:cysteine-rich repeat secretory protein 55-like n=1 Tax=Vitis riparia TaxID=96939 RepID=UPI00155AF7C9|nr:cysteine-rich repeat secretory protein 55-like [Vitis riparia]
MTLSHHLLLLGVLSLWHCSADSADPLGVFCDKDAKIGSPKESAYIDDLSVQLVLKASTSGFVAISYGSGQVFVHGLAQCRGDVGKEACSTCIQDAAMQIRARCPNEADARIWFDYCFLRYSNKDFIGKLDTRPGILYRNGDNVTIETERFNEELGKLMENIGSQAVERRNEGLGKGQTKLSPFVTLYALAQCTRDLSPLSCAQCLSISVGNFPNFCNNRKGCRVLYSSCYTRYELYPIFFPLGSTQRFSNTQMMMVYP